MGNKSMSWDRATSKGNETKSKMKHPSDIYAHAEIRTQVVVIVRPRRRSFCGYRGITISHIILAIFRTNLQALGSNTTHTLCLWDVFPQGVATWSYV